MINWIKSLFKKKQSLRDAFAEDFPNSWGKPVEKPAKRPRLYKQATVVTKGELPRKTLVKKTRPLPSKATIAKKAVGKKTTTTKGSK